MKPAELTEEAVGAESPPPLDDGQPNLVTDVLWAYGNLDHPSDRPDNAPSVGATSLLAWARSARSRFFEQVLPRALSAKTRADADREENWRNEKMDLQEAKDHINAVMAEAERSRIEHTPQQIIDDVEATLQEWAGEYGVEFSPDCFESTLCHLVDTLDDCALAAADNPKAFAQFVEAGGTHGLADSWPTPPASR